MKDEVLAATVFCMSSKVLTGVNTKKADLLGVALSVLVDTYQHFRATMKTKATGSSEMFVPIYIS
jgi:hypothetical protein